MTSPEVDGFGVEAVEAHLKSVLESQFFSKKANARRLLKLLVTSAIDRTAISLTRKNILKACFSTKSDEQIVSTEKRRLRLYLQQYYDSEGSAAAFHFVVGHEADFQIRIKDKVLDSQSSLIGRSLELEALANGLRKASIGTLHVALIEGSAGFGKTTTVDAHVARYKRQRPRANVGLSIARDVELSFQSYQPLEEALSSLCRSVQSSDRSEISAQLETLAPSWASRVDGKTNASPPSKLQLARFLEAISIDDPTLLVLEDIHLADPSLLSYIDYLIQTPRRRMQIVLTYRPESLHGLVKQLLKLTTYEFVERLHLGPLNKSDVAAYLNQRFKPNVFSPDLALVVSQLTDGCPFYIKKIAEHLESVGLAKKDAGKERSYWRLTSPVGQIAASLPDDLESVIDLSFSQLANEDQRILLAGALQGEEFESAIVSQVIQEDPAAVEERLKNIAVRSNLIQFSQSWIIKAKNPSVRYRFKHALDYRGALRAFEREPTRRARCSRSTAEALSTLLPFSANREATVATLLSVAGEYDEALPHFVRAANAHLTAFCHCACQQTAALGLEAASHCEQGESTVVATINLLIASGVSKISTNGFSDLEAVPLFDQGLEMAEQHRIDSLLPTVLYGTWVCHTGLAGLGASFKYAQRLAHLDEDLGTSGSGRGLIALGLSLLHMGELRQAHEKLMLVVSRTTRFDQMADTPFRFQLDARVVSRCQAARALCLLGKFNESKGLVSEAIEVARNIGSSQAFSYSLTMAASMCALTEDFAACRMYTTEAINIAGEYGFFQEQIWATIIDSFAAYSLQPNARQLERCRIACETYDAAGCTVAATELNTMLAKVYLRHGDYLLSSEIVERALRVSERLKETYFVPELLRLKAECLSAGDGEVSAAALAKSLEIARGQGALIWELRTLMTLTKFATTTAMDSRSIARQLLSCLSKVDDESGPLLVAARSLSAETERRASVVSAGLA